MSIHELILCVSTAYLRQSGLKDGLVLGNDAGKILSLINDERVHCYRVRRHVETHRYFKQVIPYVVLRHGAEIFSYPRDGGEDRLHGKWSIGLGGHVNAEDYHLADGNVAPYMIAALRELREEADLHDPLLTVHGIVNEDETDVGKVHIGVVLLCDVADKSSVKIGGEIAGGEWMSVPGLHINCHARMEPWSKYVLQNLYANSLVKAAVNR